MQEGERFCGKCGNDNELQQSDTKMESFTDKTRSVITVAKWLVSIIMIPFVIMTLIIIGANSMMAGMMFIILALLGVAISVAIYLVPSFIAHSRNHESKHNILVVNLFLGWTVLFWYGCLVWTFWKSNNKLGEVIQLLEDIKNK